MWSGSVKCGAKVVDSVPSPSGDSNLQLTRVSIPSA